MRIFNKTSRKRGKKTNSISCYQGNPIRRHVRVHKTREGTKKTQTVSAEKIDPPTTASDLLFAGGDIKETFFFFYLV